MVAAGLEGCQWNSELYQAYVNEKNGNIESCYGACYVSLDQDKCQKHEGEWIAEKCEILNNGDVDNTNSDSIKDLASCRNAGGVWSEAYCQIDLNHKDKCTAAGGEWAEYHMLDLGDGLYIRKITHEDNSEQFICGSYALVITNHQNASSCKQEDIDKFIQSQKYLICPVGTTCQLAYQQEIESEDNEQNEENINSKENLVAICSSCPQNSIMCRNAQGEFVCTYIESDAENCGECGNKCEDGYSCAGGECKADMCANPNVKCGVADDGVTLKCHSANDHCGATCENGKIKGGERCVTNASCRSNVDGNKCECDTDYYPVMENGKIVKCVNPSNDSNYCGIKPEKLETNNTNFCGNNEYCNNGVCTCNQNYIKCYDECIRPETDNHYCGAKGNCQDNDPNSENYQGEKCGVGSVCNHGVCECDIESGYVNCSGKCIKPNDSSTCVEFVDGGECQIRNCSSFNGICKSYNEFYRCECREGLVLCGETCIDPQTDNQYCGASGLCNSEDDLKNFSGKNCKNNLNAPLCANGDCTANCPGGQNVCDGSCVDFSSDVLNCGKCGNSCNKYDNGIGECKDGCSLKGCMEGYSNCDDNDANGCEINSDTDVNNCGVCKHKCELANTAISKCELGICEVKDCQDDYGNCDGDSNNGCETAINVDVDNCGSCFNKCAFDNGIPKCESGVCKLDICELNYGNCDGESINGCEHLLGQSNDNCGCGERCESGKVCNGGRCCYPTDTRVEPEITSKADCCNPDDHVWHKSSSCNKNEGCFACSVTNPGREKPGGV
jgi:hypothetical protein